MAGTQRPTEAKLGYTTTLERGTGEGAAIEYSDVGEVTDLTVWDGSRDSVEVTNHRSPGFSLEFIPGMIDWGSVSFEMNFVPSASITRDLLDDFKSAGNQPWRVTFPDGETWTFLAALTRYSVTAPVKDVMRGSFELKVSGAPELSTEGAQQAAQAVSAPTGGPGGGGGGSFEPEAA